MKTLYILLLMLFVQLAGAQELKPVSKVQTQESLTRTAVKTNQVYNSLPVYRSSQGKLFVVIKSKNNNFYKLYLTQK